VRIVSLFGSAALAGYTIAIRILTFHHSSELGIEQRGGHTGGPKPGRKTTRSERKHQCGVLAFYNMLFLGIIG